MRVTNEMCGASLGFTPNGPNMYRCLGSDGRDCREPAASLCTQIMSKVYSSFTNAYGRGVTDTKIRNLVKNR